MKNQLSIALLNYSIPVQVQLSQLLAVLGILQLHAQNRFCVIHVDSNIDV